MSLSPESNLKLAQLRTRFLQGEQLTQEELRESIELMRQARGQAATAVASRAKKQKVSDVDSDALLGELGNLSL